MGFFPTGSSCVFCTCGSAGSAGSPWPSPACPMLLISLDCGSIGCEVGSLDELGLDRCCVFSSDSLPEFDSVGFDGVVLLGKDGPVGPGEALVVVIEGTASIGDGAMLCAGDRARGGSCPE